MFSKDIFLKKTFFKATITFSSLCALAIGLWFIKACVLQNEDLARYKKLVLKKEGPETGLSSIYQTRQGISKDLWYVQEDNQRLHHRIESESSVLTMVSKKSKVDIVENLENITCFMQDKLYRGPDNAPMQQLRFFKANEGTYHYANQQFFAQTVQLSLLRSGGYNLPKQLEPSSAYLRGVAQDVSFFINDNVPKFHAEQFKASLNPSEAISPKTGKK